MEIQEARMVRSERELSLEAILLLAVFGKHGNVVQKLAGVRANSATGVGLGKYGEMVTARCLTDFDGESKWVVALNQVKRHQMVANERCHLLPPGKWQTHPPKTAAGPDRAAPGMSTCGDTAVLLGAQASWLGYIVQECGGKQDSPFNFWKGSPGVEAGHRFTDHAHVSPDVALGMPGHILRAAAQVPYPRIHSVVHFPIHAPIGRLRRGRKRSAHNNSSHYPLEALLAPREIMFGSMGRCSKWLLNSGALDSASIKCCTG